MIETIDWDSVRDECVQTGQVLKIPKPDNYIIPQQLHESNLGLEKGAIRQWRDDHTANSLHIHEFQDYFLAHTDGFNPEHHPVAHGIVDIPGITLGIVVGTIAVYMLTKTAQGFDLVPDEEDNW
ncbi:MAG TPA: hypothetical protein P5543_04550 [Planctomycetota bacterium]|nr:hypothetical protein [Planctomycetota bacterium]HRU51443.1 hypothetical protein [Planctomycetota bacterium]